MEYCQKYGMPKLVFHYESERDRQQLEKDLAEERVLNNILLKGDRAVDIANAPASGASLPQRELLNLAESQCHKLILGQTLTSDTSQHGGSLAQAKVHAGVHAEVVKKRAAFVADVLNTQLIPAIVLLNYGTLEVPMPELVFKLPQEGVTLERVQVLKTALEIKGMRIKKSEAYEFVGFAQPAEGDDVFESASGGGEMAGLAGLLAKGKGKPQDDTAPDDDPNKPKKKVKPSTAEDAEPVSAAKSAPTDPAQEWLAPIKQKFLEARKAGASMADLKQMLLTMHPNTKALAKAFANNILAGFAGEAEEVDAANPWGCNQYGHRKGHKGGESKNNESDDVYDFDNMEPDERLQRAIDELGEVEEEDIDWDDYDKAQEVKKIFHPDNHKVAQWRKERMINEVGNRVTDALRHLANVNKASRDFRNPNRPTEDDVARAEEAFGKAVHEWRRFHRARLEVQGWDKKAIDGYLSRWPEYMETANEEDIDAANPYGCNQYGEGWKAPHNGRASKAGAPVKKTDPTEEERKQKQIEELRRQAEQKRKEEEERKNKLNSLNKQPFDNGRSGIEIRTGLDAYDIAELLNKVGYRYGSQRQERARAWEGYGVSRIYFGRDYVTIKDGVITNRDLRKVRACTACDDAMNAINAVLGNDSTDRVRSTRADDEPENTEEIDAVVIGENESEDIEAKNIWGCNKEHKCPQKGTTREPKLKTEPRLFRVDPDAPIHKQKVQLAEAIEKAAHDGVHLEAVITRPEFGELIIDCGKPGKTEAKRNREQKAENEKAEKEGRERKIISSGGNGAIHAMEGRHHVNPFDIAEAIIEGKVTQDTNHASRINLETEKIKVTLEREIKQGSKKISKTRAKLHTASKI